MEDWLKCLSLKALADRCEGASESYLLMMAASGKLTLSVHLKDVETTSATFGKSGYAGIRTEDAETIRQMYEEAAHQQADRTPDNKPSPLIKLSRFIGPDREEFELYHTVTVRQAIHGNRYTGEPSRPAITEKRPGGSWRFYLSSLVVMRKEVERLEAKFPELCGGIQDNLRGKNVDESSSRPEVKARTDLHIIGALVDLLCERELLSVIENQEKREFPKDKAVLDFLKSEKLFPSKAKLIDSLIFWNPDLPGMSKKTLEVRFKDGLAAINSSE